MPTFRRDLALIRAPGPKATFAAAVTPLTAGTLRGHPPNSKRPLGRPTQHCLTRTRFRVSVIDASVGYIITTLPTPNVFELGFSPLGTYIITWQRPAKDDEGNATKNLKVWRTVPEDAEAENGQERTVVGEYVQKSQTGWNLQYTADEKFCARVVTNEVQFYQSGDLKTVWNKLRVEGVTDFAVSPGKNHSVAVFVPERKASLQVRSRGFRANSDSRGCPPQSRSSRYPSSPLPCRRKPSTREIKCSSSGTSWERA